MHQRQQPPPVRGPRLVEREREQGELATLVDEAAAGSGRAVVIEGPAGIGKSRLLVDTRGRAAEAGLVTLLARSSELERDFPFGVVRQLFEAVVADPAGRERLLAGAAASAASVFDALEGDGGADADVSFAALHGLFWLTLNLAADAPVMLAIDDLQWCDRASLRFLAYLARRLEGAPILVAATVRSGEPPTDATLQAEVAGDPATAIVRPAPLSASAVAELVRERLGDDANPDFCAACQRATGGNPLLVRQLLSALEADGVTPDAEHIDVVRDVGPRAVSRSVLMRLARLRGDAVAVARAIAILGDSADLPAVAALADVDEQQAAEATGLLVRAELLRPEPPIGFAHPLIRDAVYRELPPGERELQHLHAARVLAGLGASAEQVSSHLLAVPRRGDAWVARTLRDSGQSALRRGAADSAVTYLTRALDEPPPAEERGDVLAALGRSEALTMTGSAAEHLAAAHALLSDPGERAHAAYELGRLLIFSAPPGEAARVARAAVDELAGADSPELVDLRQRLESLELAAWFFGADVDDLAPNLEQLRTAPVGPRPGAKMLAAMAANDWAMIAGPAEDCAALALAALEGDVLVQTEIGLNTVFCGGILTVADRDEALTLWDRVLADAHRRGSLVGVTGFRFWRGWTLMRRGELEDAEEALWTAIDDFTAWGYTPLLIWPAAFLGGLLVERGDLDGARSALERGGPLNPSQGSLYWLLAHGELMLASGRPDQAVAAADQVHDLAGRAVNPAYFPWRSLKARALDRLGRADEALALVREELEIARRWGAPGTVGSTLRVLGTLERGDGIEHLEEACELLARSPARLEHAKALAALGSAIRRARRPSDAREPLRQALELAARAGATALVEHVRDELKASGARPRVDALSGVDALTASERRVAGLAKDGRTNRDIAQELFVTPKTVEVHLSNAYRKLGIRSRRELAPALPGG